MLLYLSSQEKLMRNWLRHWPIVLLAAGAIFLVLQGTGAQQPSKSKSGSAKTETKVDRDLQAWFKILTEKMTDRHDSIRDSARTALASLGTKVLPALRMLETSEDGATAEAARRVVRRIEGAARLRRTRASVRWPAARLASRRSPGPGLWGSRSLARTEAPRLWRSGSRVPGSARARFRTRQGK